MNEAELRFSSGLYTVKQIADTLARLKEDVQERLGIHDGKETVSPWQYMPRYCSSA
jgi:hypothetical protein